MSIENKEVLRELVLRLKDAQADNIIIPDEVFNIIQDLEDNYLKVNQ